MSTAPLERYLLRKMVTCSILILPAVYIIIMLRWNIIFIIKAIQSMCFLHTCGSCVPKFFSEIKNKFEGSLWGFFVVVCLFFDRQLWKQCPFTQIYENNLICMTSPFSQIQFCSLHGDNNDIVFLNTYLHFKFTHNIPVHTKLSVLYIAFFYILYIVYFVYYSLCLVTVILLHCGASVTKTNSSYV